MQRFPCPFCGLRDEREFRYASEAGKTRPDTTAEVSDAAWRDYLHVAANPRGPSAEVWVHLPCQEYFVMERDTVLMAVLDARQLRRGET